MSQDPITWQAVATIVGLMLTGLMLLVNIRGQFRQAQEKSDERARRTYDKIDELRRESAENFVRKDVHAEQIRRVQDTAEEAHRTAADVAERLRCPIRPPGE